MATKKTIRIDRDQCIGCGQCVNACPGGALQMIDGKAQLVREDFCDGLGVCIGECPVDAIHFEEVEAPAIHAAAPAAPVAPEKNPAAGTADSTEHAHHHHAGGCPGKMNMVFQKPQPHAGTPGGCPSCAGNRPQTPEPATAGTPTADAPSALGAWPIQLHLIQPEAPQFAGADVLIGASCSAFACGSFHQKYLNGRGLIIACPKLDQQDGYLEKLTRLFQSALPASVTVARMSVPCCGGLTRLVLAAREAAGSNLPLHEVTIGLDGTIAGEQIL